MDRILDIADITITQSKIDKINKLIKSREKGLVRIRGIRGNSLRFLKKDYEDRIKRNDN
jgi:hypothetical protein